MTNIDVIAMAREAGAIHIHKSPKEFALVGNEAIERFAELVASLVRADAIAEEREACAKACEVNHHTVRHSMSSFECAAAIRARGQRSDGASIRRNKMICDECETVAHCMKNGCVPKMNVQQEPVALKWQQAPVKTQWGDDMVVASVAIDKDHTVDLYCERDQTPKVDAMFAQRQARSADTWVGLTYEEAKEIYTCIHGYDSSKRIAQAIEAKLKEKNNGN